MKNIKYIVIIVLISFLQLNAEIVKRFYKTGELFSEKTYKNGKLDGLSLEYHKNGLIEYKKSYKNGLKMGEYKRFDENGTITLDIIFENNIQIYHKSYYKNRQINEYSKKDLKKKNVITKRYYENGQLEYQFERINGKIIIQNKFFNNGSLEFYRDIKTGIRTNYYKSGKIRKLASPSYDKNNNLIKKKSDIKYYYENGQLKNQYRYIHGYKGEISGIFEIVKTFYDTGELKSEKSYNGELEGLTKEYYKDGTVKAEKNYKDDSLHGSYKEYFENGKIKIKAKYFNSGSSLGELDDLYEEYDKNGKLLIQRLYKSPRKNHDSYDAYLLNEKLYKDGKLISDKSFEMEDYYIKYYYEKEDIPNKKSFIAKIKDKYKEKFPKKEIKKMYYDNGNLRMEVPTINGLRNGKAKLYYDTGELFITQEFKNGKETSKQIKYNKKGELLYIKDGSVNE